MKEKKKLKAMPSSMRMKKRFISLKIYSDKKISLIDLKKALNNSFDSFMGFYGRAKQNPKIIDFDSSSGVLLIRASLETLPQTITALLMLKKAGAVLVVPKILTVSGSVKKASLKKKPAKPVFLRLNPLNTANAFI